jgi:hypothetical protein
MPVSPFRVLHLTMRLSTNPFLLNTPQPIQTKVRPQAGGELAPIVSEEASAENRLA